MVFRFIIRILANNEQLVQKLSESYPMRRAAQIVVRAMNSGKFLIEEYKLDQKATPEQFRNAMKQFAQDLQKQIKATQDDFKSKMK